MQGSRVVYNFLPKNTNFLKFKWYYVVLPTLIVDIYLPKKANNAGTSGVNY